MLFNSLEFFVFLPIVFSVYWCLKRSLRQQNLVLLLASYVFYGWWDYRFLSLIVLSSSVDFVIGKQIHRAKSPLAKRRLLLISLATNLGLLAYFKYVNFFIASAVELLTSLGIQANEYSLQVILPVGISFYTFQTLSYTIDIYRGKMEPTDSALSFFVFVSFFPQLVAGPIERAAQLLPQFERRRSFNSEDAKDGLRQMLWGLFKKVVIADRCAAGVDHIFANYSTLNASTLWLGAFLFAMQIYGDFSGYSGFARGVAKLFGISILQNFSYPYFARSISEFWRRWHISLSTFFRDYVYIPLGGNRSGRPRQLLNALITFTVSGLWHGANWTFVAWGFFHGVLYGLSLFVRSSIPTTKIIASGKLFPTPRESLHLIRVFLLVTIAWVLFRAPSLDVAVEYLLGMADPSVLQNPLGTIQPTILRDEIIFAVVMSLVMLCCEWRQREQIHALQIAALPVAFRWAIYYVLVFLVLGFLGENKQFIYFQF